MILIALYASIIINIVLLIMNIKQFINNFMFFNEFMYALNKYNKTKSSIILVEELEKIRCSFGTTHRGP